MILEILYFMIPVYAANAAPVFFRKVSFLNYPLDFGKKWNGKRILGNHKTFRGLFFGVLLGIAATFVQSLLGYGSILDYSNWLFLGFLLSFGALFGDAFKSFFKRRMSIPSGKSFIPFDQIDYTLGSLLFVSFFYDLSLIIWLYAFGIKFIVHILANYAGFYMGIRRKIL